MRLKICVAAWLIATGFIATERVSAQRAADAAAAAGNPGLVGVRRDERRVLEYLIHDWNSDSAITSVDVAMDALKVRPSDELRFRIGSHIKAHPELHATIRKWGWETIVLTPIEKLVARGIVNPERDKHAPPAKADLAKMVGIPERDVNRAVEMLARYDILKIDPSVGGIGYVATKPRYSNWPQWLDFQFHRVSLASGRTFCVDWASDFLSLVSGKLGSERITINDSSPDSTTRIRVMFDKGQFVKAEPASTIVFNGGGWEANNLFSSEEALNRWLERYPELKNRPHASVPDTLERIKARQRKP